MKIRYFLLFCREFIVFAIFCVINSRNKPYLAIWREFL